MNTTMRPPGIMASLMSRSATLSVDQRVEWWYAPLDRQVAWLCAGNLNAVLCQETLQGSREIVLARTIFWNSADSLFFALQNHRAVHSDKRTTSSHVCTAYTLEGQLGAQDKWSYNVLL